MLKTSESRVLLRWNSKPWTTSSGVLILDTNALSGFVDGDPSIRTAIGFRLATRDSHFSFVHGLHIVSW
jgi:hypothetical protein